ncbi:hypothetical protein GG344DRAFT_70827 [Lentinula edodes]|nr:hypothetical protein GG344DRAFT_70827 [Lentinula edodes]
MSYISLPYPVLPSVPSIIAEDINLSHKEHLKLHAIYGTEGRKTRQSSEVISARIIEEWRDPWVERWMEDQVKCETILNWLHDPILIDFEQPLVEALNLFLSVQLFNHQKNLALDLINQYEDELQDPEDSDLDSDNDRDKDYNNDNYSDDDSDDNYDDDKHHHQHQKIQNRHQRDLSPDKTSYLPLCKEWNSTLRNHLLMANRDKRSAKDLEIGRILRSVGAFTLYAFTFDLGVHLRSMRSVQSYSKVVLLGLLGCTIALSLCHTVVFKMSYSVSNTASPPWIGMHIRIIKGEYKAYHGYVHHVNPSNSSISGLKIVVELSAHTSNGTNSLVTVDYDDIREFEHWRTLAEVQPLGLYQTSYNLRPDYFPPQLDVPYIPQPGPEVVSRFTTPFPTASDLTLDNFWGVQPLEEIKPQDLHWILHPAFNQKSLHVFIDPTHSLHGGYAKWVYVDNGIVSLKKQGGHTEQLELAVIQRPMVPPARTCKSLLAIIEGNYFGELVRCIYWTRGECGEEKLWVAIATNAGTLSETLHHDVFPVSRSHTVAVKTDAEVEKHGKSLILDLRSKLMVNI